MNRIFAAIAIAATLASVTPAFARGGGPGASNTGLPSGFSQGQKNGWDNGDVPPGWGKGKKTGWGTTQPASPPGLRNR